MNEFEKLVAEMRKYQKEYFKHRFHKALQNSKSAEKEVDEYLKTLTNPKLGL